MADAMFPFQKRRYSDVLETTAVSRMNFLNLVAPTFLGLSVAAAALGADSGFYLGADLGPDNLVESELFGHVRGAFTDAMSNKRGLFEVAHRGSLFLDEVADLSLAAQAKILRVVQNGEIQKVV